MSDQSFMPDDPERPPPKPSRKKKPIGVWMYRDAIASVIPAQWWKWGSYADEETAKEVVRRQRSKDEYHRKMHWHIGTEKPKGKPCSPTKK